MMQQFKNNFTHHENSKNLGFFFDETLNGPFFWSQPKEHVIHDKNILNFALSEDRTISPFLNAVFQLAFVDALSLITIFNGIFKVLMAITYYLL